MEKGTGCFLASMKVNGFVRSMLLLSGVLMITPLKAADLQPEYENYNYHIYGGGFYMFPDRDRTKEDGSYGWQINLGKRMSDRWWLEGQFFGDTIEKGKNAGTDFYQYGLGLDLQYAFGNRDEFTPFLLAGIGGVHNDVVPNSQDDNNFFGNVGIGFVKRFKAFDLVRFRGEARAVYDDFMSGMVDYRIGLGIEVALGSPRYRPEPEPRVVIKEVQVPVVVEKVVVQQAAPQDNDLDKDGVINELDECPNTLPGVKVDKRGCAIEQTLTMKEVTFEFNSARLTLNAKRLLDEVVTFLKAEPGVKMRVNGHTDGKGSDAYNLKLSKERAASVRQYLVEQGISADRLTSEGFGKRKPVASNDTESGREANRRVEFDIKPSN